MATILEIIARARTREAEKAIERLGSRLDRTEASAKRVRATFKNTGLRGAQKDYDKLKAAAQQAGVSINKLSSRFGSLKGRISQGRGDVNKLSSSLKQLRGDMQAATRAIERQNTATVKANKSTSQFNSTFTRFSQQIRLVEGPLGGTAARVATFGQIMRSSAGPLGVLVGLFSALAAGAGALTLALFNLERQLGGIRVRMDLLTGSSAQTSAEFNRLYDESQRLGINMGRTVQEFSKFAIAAKNSGLTLQETRDTFRGVATAISGAGLNAQQAQRIFVALEQMLSRGVVSSEELKRQMGNALPGAFQAAADSIGVTRQELLKMLENGEIMSKEFLPDFALQLEETFAKAARVDTLEKSIDRLKNAFMEMGRAILDSGVKEYFIDFFNALEGAARRSAEATKTVSGRQQAIREASQRFGPREQAAIAAGDTELLNAIQEQRLAFIQRRTAELARGGFSNMDLAGPNERFGRNLGPRFFMPPEDQRTSSAAARRAQAQPNVLGPGVRASTAANQEILRKEIDRVKDTQKRLESIREDVRKRQAEAAKEAAEKRADYAKEAAKRERETMEWLADDTARIQQEMAENGLRIAQEASERRKAQRTAEVNLAKHMYQVQQEELRKYEEVGSRVSDSIATSFERMFFSISDGTKSASEAFKDMANSILSDIARITIRENITGPLASGVGKLLGNILGGSGFSMGSGIQNVTSSNIPMSGGRFGPANALGNVYGPGGMMRFAKGGVVSSPTVFPFAKGTGLMGEAGPEAIMPLKRGSDGKLGVQSSGGDSNINITIVNENGGEVETQQNGPDITVLIKRVVAQDIGEGGNVYSAIRKTFNVQQGLTRRS